MLSSDLLLLIHTRFYESCPNINVKICDVKFCDNVQRLVVVVEVDITVQEAGPRESCYFEQFSYLLLLTTHRQCC